MLTRVTQSTLMNELRTGVARIQRRLADVQEVVTSQKRLQRPSDDPVGTAQASRLRTDIANGRAYRAAVGVGQVMLGAQDGALDQAHAILTRASEIATQQAGDLATAESRQQAALEVEELERALVGIGNTTVAGRQIFGGLVSGTRAFVPYDDPGFDPATAYVGPAEPFSVQTAAGQTVRISTPGNEVLGDAIAALDRLRQSLAAGSPPVVELDAVKAAAETVRAERGDVGVRLAQLNARDDAAATEVTDARGALGDIEDADMTESIVELLQLQNALQATLQSGQSLFQINVLDYLRF